jgi:diketogulonate reductase-like aldo/keto reductase
LREFCATHGIQVQAWAPLGQGKGLLSDPAVRAVAVRNDRTPAQVVLRWHLARETAVIPKSVTPERIAENFRLDDFSLSVADMNALDGVGSGEDRLGPDPETFDVV